MPQFRTAAWKEDSDATTANSPEPQSGTPSSRSWALRVARGSDRSASVVGVPSILTVATHPDDFRETDNSVTDFNQVVAAECGGEGGESEGPALTTISLGAMNLSARHLLKQGAALVLATALMSLVSFGFAAGYFGLALRLPSPREQAPDGYSSWEACTGGPDPASPVTALGEQLPFATVRAMVSLPKFFDVATMASLIGVLLAGGLTWAAVAHSAAQYTIAAITVPVFLLGQGSGTKALPNWVDPAFSLSMVCLFSGVPGLWMIRSRRQANPVVARCPKLLFTVAMFLLFLLNTVLLNILAVVARYEVQPALVVCGSVAVLRGFGFALRQVLKSLSVSFLACFAVLFTFDIANIVALRRYVLALPSLGDAAASAAVNALAEFACNAASGAYAVYSYNSFVKQRRAERASTQIHLFVTAIISDLVAEHVALHSSLGYSLFMDSRVLSIDALADLSLVSQVWAVSFAIEIVADAITVVPMLLFLPVSFTSLFGRYLRSWAAVFFVLCACVHPHLVGLHSYLDQDRFFC